jgi:hypothetical protein
MTAQWVGWLRRNRRELFQRVAEAGTLEEAHRKLLEAARRWCIRDPRCRLLTRGTVPAIKRERSEYE